jgi:hypothetical protein
MTHIIRFRLALVAVAAFAALVVIASPASATDDPAPLGPTGAPPSSTQKQSKAGKVRVRVRYRKRAAGSCGGFRISLSGAGTAGVTRVDVRAGKRRIGRDRSRPFKLAIGGRRLRGSRKVQISLVGPNGTRTITRRLRSCSAKRRRVSAQRSAFEPIPVAMALDALLGRVATSAV